MKHRQVLDRVRAVVESGDGREAKARPRKRGVTPAGCCSPFKSALARCPVVPLAITAVFYNSIFLYHPSRFRSACS